MLLLLAAAVVVVLVCVGVVGLVRSPVKLPAQYTTQCNTEELALSYAASVLLLQTCKC
jgi:hypothetical protein